MGDIPESDTTAPAGESGASSASQPGMRPRVRTAVPASDGGDDGGSATTSRPLTARRTFVVLVVVLAFGIGLLFFYSIRQVIAWLLLAILLSVALDPLVSWLTRHRWRRGVAALAVSFLFLILLIGILIGLTAPFITQAQNLITNFPGFVQDLFRRGPLRNLDQHYHIYRYLKGVSPASVLRAVTGGSSVLQALSKGISLVFGAVTVLTLMVMLLIEGPRAWGGLVGLFGEERREWVERLGERAGKSVGGYVRGNLFISVIAATGAYVVLLILGVPYPLPLALIVGVLDIIPLVGAVIGAAICVIVSLTVGWVPAVVLIVYFVVYQQVENNFIQPVVYSRTVSLTPLTVLLASLVGAVIAGILGVLVAIPLASAVLIFIDEYRARRQVAGWEVLEPLERVEAAAPAADDVLETEAQPPPEPAPEKADEKADETELGEATAERIESSGGRPVAEPGPPRSVRDDVAEDDHHDESAA